MSRRGCALLVLVAAFLSGCVEERIEIVLEADGSGRITADVVQSDRLMTAYHELMRTRSPVVGSILGMRISTTSVAAFVRRHDEEAVEEALNLHAYERVTLFNGARRTRYSGSFASLDFLNTAYAQETLGLDWVPRSDGSNVLYVDLAPRHPDRWAANLANRHYPEPTLRLLYGLFQGYRKKIEIQFPFPVADTVTAERVDDQTLRWDLDLRNHQRLEASETLDFLSNAGRAVVTFALDDLPDAYLIARLGRMAFPASSTATSSDVPQGLTAAVRRVQVTREQLVNETTASRPTQAMIEFSLAVPEDLVFMQHREPQLRRAEDEDGESLLDRLAGRQRSGIWPEAGGYAIRMQAPEPQLLPDVIYRIEGVLPVVIAQGARELRFGPDAFKGLVRTPGSPQPETAHGITLSRLDPNAVTLCTGDNPDPAGTCRVLQVNLLMEDGRYEEAWANRPHGNERQMSFRTPILEAEQIVVTLVESYDVYDVPFALDRLELP